MPELLTLLGFQQKPPLIDPVVFPDIDIDPLQLTLGGGSDEPSGSIQNVLQFQDNLTGAHWEFPERQPETYPRERSVEHGMLTVTLSHTPQKPARRIPISTQTTTGTIETESSATIGSGSG